MAAMGLPSSVKAESLLRGACGAMAAAAALLLGLSAQTKTVLFVEKKAVPQEVQALWVLIVASAAASGYHVVQLARTLYLGRFAGDGGRCRRLCRGVACVSFLLDKACLVGLLGVEALQWRKVCNIYTRFCEQVAAGLLCSLIAAVGMAVLSAFSARDLFRHPYSPSAWQCTQL